MRNPTILQVVTLSAVLTNGCSKLPNSKATTPPQAPSARPNIAERCPFARAETSEGANPAPPRVFVEVAIVEGDVAAVNPQSFSGSEPRNDDPAGAGFGAFLNDPRVNIPQVSNILAANDVPYRIPWDPSRAVGKNGCPKPDRWNLSLRAHMESIQPNEVSLAIAFIPVLPQGMPTMSEKLSRQCRLNKTVTAKDQQTIVLGGFTEQPLPTEQSMLVITPYIIWTDADIQALLECKLKRAQREPTGK